MTTRVWCARHGETVWNAAGRWQGGAPVPLSETGLAQSRQLADYLAANGVRFDVIYSSDQVRAMQTAQMIADALGQPVYPEPRLREVGVGDWQGLTRSEVEAWDAERFAAYLADWYNVPPPNGESRGQLKARMRAAFDAITARHHDQAILLVSHGGSLGMLIESLFGKIERPSLTNTSLTVVEQETPGSAWQLVRVAWSPHVVGLPLDETW